MAEKKKETTEKPLDKMTVKELREIAKEIPEITGVHGMNKPELYSAIAKAKGIEEEPAQKPVKKKEVTSDKLTVADIKKKIQEYKGQRAGALQSSDKKNGQNLQTPHLQTEEKKPPGGVRNK